MPETILTIDDHEMIREIMEIHLNDAGYCVTGAKNASQGIDLAASEDFDLVLCDLGLPDQSGLDLIRAIKALHADLPIVVVTGRLDEQIIEEAKAVGADGYLSKPFMKKDLLAVVRTTLLNT